MTKQIEKSRLCVIGLGCLFTLALFAVLSGSLFEASTAALLERQIPLTASGDFGALLGSALLIAFCRFSGMAVLCRNVRTHAVLIVSAGLSVAIMIRSGMLFHASPVDAVLGDFLFGFFFSFAAFLWWRAMRDEPSGQAFEQALAHVLQALVGASAAFIALSLMPRGIILLFACLVMPLAMGVCLARYSGKQGQSAGVAEPEHGDEHQLRALGPRTFLKSDPRLKTVLLTMAFSVFVSDLLMNLFPVSLYSEASPLFALFTGDPAAGLLGNLSEPAFLAAALMLAVALAFWLLALRGPVRLPHLCFIGFFAVAVGYVTFPYHFPGGAPIGIAEAGRCIIVLFALATLTRYAERFPRREQSLLVSTSMALTLAGMMVADVLVMTLYADPAFDYMDFTFRTIFGGAGLLAMVALLLGPLPKIHALTEGGGVTSPDQAGNEVRGTQSAGTAPDNQEARLAAFAEAYRLSPRECEILALLSSGRDVPYIEQALVLSKSTVKTHIRHMYDKCGVSSRQDLLDLLMKQ